MTTDSLLRAPFSFLGVAVSVESCREARTAVTSQETAPGSKRSPAPEILVVLAQN